MKNLTKRILSLLIAIAMVLTLAVPSVSTEAAMNIPKKLGKHHAFVVIDADTAEVVMKHHSVKRVYPASTTKLMTALVLVENGDLGKRIKITDKMLKQCPYGMSAYGLKKGEKYTLKTMLNMILIESDGDAAICAAIAVFGSVKKCVDAMNAKTESLGLKKTHFDNPVGLDIGDNYNAIYTTAKDMAMITKAAMGNEVISKIVAKKSYRVKQVNGKKGRRIYSTNIFYSTVDYPKDKYTIVGSKTGTTNAAGYVFSATAVGADGRCFICVYMGKENKVQTFKDIRKIFNKIYAS